MAAITCATQLTTKVLRRCTFQAYARFSTANATVDTEEKLHRFRTLENNPTRHSEQHLSKFYTIPPDVKKRLFLSGGVPGLLEIQMKAFRESCVMIREPFLEVKSYLESFNYSLPAIRFVIYGENGVGKSLTIMHLVHYAYEAKYLLLYIPWVSNWTKRPKEIPDSQSRPGRIDLPVESVIWLQHFKALNLELLLKLDLKTSKKYTWSQREITEKGQPLMEVIEHGLNRGIHASDCIAVLLKEIKQQSQFGKFKTLVIIDGVNAFYFKTNIKRPDKTLVKATDVTIVRAFEKMLKNDWNNAAIVTTVDRILTCRDSTVVLPVTPRALLGKEGFEVLDPFIPVEVKNYTEKDADSILDYYIDRMWIQLDAARTERGRKELKFLSGLNPYSLMKICDPL